jgi:GNAT superfamily N-acetyltransferase
LSDITITAAGRLLFARTADRVVGLMTAIAQEHGVGLMFPPELADDADADKTALRLVQAAVAHLKASGCSFCQLVLPTPDREKSAPFAAAGFVHLTDALILHRSLAEAPPIRPGGIVSVACDPIRDRETLEGLIGEIGVGSLDCPELDVWRTPRSLLEGHRTAAGDHPAEWRLYEQSGKCVGAAFAFHDRDADCWELLFFGVVPEARGRGLGHAILQDVVARAATTAGAIRAAVDFRNAYAISTYGRSLFLPRESVEVWIHSLAAAS